MGAHPNIAHDRFPSQGPWVGRRIYVMFNFDTANPLAGIVVRDDYQDPHRTIIRLDDGRYVLGSECQYSPPAVADSETTMIPSDRHKHVAHLPAARKVGDVVLPPGWYFFDETQQRHGDIPYTTEDEAIAAWHRYAEAISGKIVEMRFDHAEARGVVRLERGIYGPTLSVNGVELGFMVLFPPEGRDPMQLLLFDPQDDDEPLAIVFTEAGRLTVVVNGDAETVRTTRTIHSGSRDHAYALPVSEEVPE